MKVKEEDLRRELLKAINGEDLIINCARRLGIRLDSFKCKLSTARIHGIESVLHSNRPGGYSDDLKLEVVDSLMKGMTKHAAARTYNITKSTLSVWLRKYAEGGQEALLEDNRGRKPSMGRKPKPKLSDYEPGSLEYLKLENEMMKRELLLLKKALPLIQESERRTSRGKKSTGTSGN